MCRLLALFILVSVSGFASAATMGRGGLYFGSKSLNHNDWGSLDSQSAWGINLDVKDQAWPVWIAAGYTTSQDEDVVAIPLLPFATTEIEGKTSEFRLGVKKDFLPLKRMLVSVSGGPAYLSGSIKSSASAIGSDSDSAMGLWAGGDLLFNLHIFSIGISYLYSQADIELFGNSIDAGGSNLAFSIGMGW